MTGEDGRTRCWWGAEPEIYREYHDHEWGRPVHDEARLFEKICLEGFQSGLSWLTILKKREGFRAAFHGFEVDRVAEMGEADVARLLGDPGIVRHRGKIEAVLNNARAARRLRDEAGSIDGFVWGFQPPARPGRVTWQALCANPTTPESVALSKALKKRGWQFVGPTTCYAFMQAMGMVDDHVAGCHVAPR